MATTFDLNTPNAAPLHGVEWLAESPKAVLALVHGHGEYTERYDHLASFLNGHGISVMGMDLPGHGRSPGKRGHFKSYEGVLNQVAALIDRAKATHPGLPVFLMGHSMGGNLVASFALRRQPSLSGVILSSPWLELAFAPSTVDVMLAKVMINIWPSFTQSSKLDATAISRDPALVKAYEEDPLIHDQVSPRLFTDVTQAGSEVLQHANDWNLPLLVYQGDADRITSHDASAKFAATAGGGDVTWHSWPGGYHEMHNEPEKQAVFELLYRWINERV